MSSDTIPDPSFPLVRLPAEFRSERQNRSGGIENETIEIFRAEGPGCIRHFWITVNEMDSGLTLEITADGAPVPQVRMELEPFFGILLGLDPYRIDSAAFQVLPKTTGEARGVGYNCYLPIPFEKSCRIVLRAGKKVGFGSMVDWHRYQEGTSVTRLRLHAMHRREFPARPIGPFTMAEISGRGFVAGIFKGLRQRDHEDMIYHTNGQLWLIDGESEPNAFRGMNEEDDFGFGFGYHPAMSRWIGSPYNREGAHFDQDAVSFRFFGTDPVSFRSSLILRCGSRPDDTETVVCYYKEIGSEAPAIRSPESWQVIGPFPYTDINDFSSPGFPEDLAAPWPDTVRFAGKEWYVHALDSSRGWIDIHPLFLSTAGQRTPVSSSVYIRTKVRCTKRESVRIRFGFDDWLAVRLNGRTIGTFRHDDGFAVADVPATLEAGDNELLVKLGNEENLQYRIWALNCTIREDR